MATDYSNYNDWYHYIDRVFRQIQTLSEAGNGIYRDVAPIGQSFAEVLQGTAQKLDVPESMEAIFEEAARTYDVPAALLKAIGKAESDFNAKAVSSAGAQGVMQLMPATARALGVKDPFDARSNIMGGAKYIADKLKQYDGNIELALAAYNAGSGNVEKYGGVPPFKETQNYIRRVKEYMGENLTTGKTVTRQSEGAARSAYTRQAPLYGGSDSGNMLQYVELMKQQMQGRLTMAGQSLLDNGDKNWL